MPELPEVETVRRGLEPWLTGRRIVSVVVREPRLRWPIAEDLGERLDNRRILALTRRGKYLLVHLADGQLILHLGMSGSLRLVTGNSPPGKHDHLDVALDDGQLLRFRDPRRFGAVVWCAEAARHPLLADLGIEPLEAGFDAARLQALCRDRATPIKSLLMDAHKIVGIGNIYANEALFRAGIHPLTAAGALGPRRIARLTAAIQATLREAIAAGGSSLRDFVDGHGNPGYFQQNYYVYGRAGEACRRCARPIRLLRQAGRATYFCPACQRR